MSDEKKVLWTPKRKQEIVLRLLKGESPQELARELGLGIMRKYNPPEVITMHQVHHPEIEITGEATARATWALQDYVINVPGEWSVHGAALYEDEYIKADGEWKIKHTGYRRIFSERWTRSEIKSLKVTESMHAPPGP